MTPEHRQHIVEELYAQIEGEGMSGVGTLRGTVVGYIDYTDIDLGAWVDLIASLLQDIR